MISNHQQVYKYHQEKLQLKPNVLLRLKKTVTIGQKKKKIQEPDNKISQNLQYFILIKYIY